MPKRSNDLPKYVCTEHEERAEPLYYYRRLGRYSRLPDDPTSPEFHRAWLAFGGDQPLEPRFKNVPLTTFDQYEPDLNSGCWLWTGAIDHHGYGIIWAGRRRREHAGWKAHRAFYEWHNGKNPGELVICHRCDTPTCVNPAHLFAGTMMDNTLDAWRKGRMKPARGERVHTAKLTAEAVRRIRRDPRTCSLIAKDYGVLENTIRSVKTGHRWGHVV